LLGAKLSRDLQDIYRNRPIGTLFFVTLAPDATNAVFLHELSYRGIKLPDAGFQVLALYRFWNIVEYWSPYRDIIGEDWKDVLKAFVPKVALAKTSDSYQQELMALIARVHDTHANLWSSLRVRPPVGDCQIPVTVRFVENSAVVSGYSRADAASSTGIKIGDVILSLDATPVTQLVDRWRPYYAASNDAARFRDIARSLTNGECGPSVLKLRRETETLTLTTPRVSSSTVDAFAGGTHDLPGETLRKLSNDVAYLKLSTVKTAQAAHYIQSASGTKGLIIDIRNYPSEPVGLSLGPLLVDKPTEHSRYTSRDLSNPGAFHWNPPVLISPRTPHYTGKIIILVDEMTQSQAEATTMVFRIALGAVVIGSTTAGADGNVSAFPLPGGLRTMISGIGVFYPDRTPTQRVGIVPDIKVTPTVSGIRDGRDELLEVALRQILGPDTPPQQIESLAKH
jgi:C-terminal processing protease CtpA/Prc